MPKITIAGIPGADGEYPLDISDGFTNRELHLVKQLSGVRAGELAEAFAAGDNDLIVALTLIAIRRSGKDVPADAIWDATAGMVTFAETEEEKAEAEELEKLPPVTAPAANGNSSGSGRSSGASSTTGSEKPANVRSLTGLPDSDTGATSDRVTSAS